MITRKIHMVDLGSQYKNIAQEIDESVLAVVRSTQFINGPAVKSFNNNLAEYLKVKHVMGCANGTDALQIALMALGLKRGDEVIVPAFTYAATAEVIGLLQLSPVMIDVDPHTFNTTAELVEKAITPKTKAIIPVHLFGQSTDMEDILAIAKAHNLFVIEDNAQAIGADYTFKDGTVKKTGTMGHVGCTSFFPSKNLGCYGDGGAMFANDDEIADNLRMIANHGQRKKYYHSVIGVNSRLDSIQAAILDIKLKHLDQYSANRLKVANVYDQAFADVEALSTPVRQKNSSHVFHQYTLKVKNGKRNELQAYLKEKEIPSMIYYPIPLYKQDAFKGFYKGSEPLPVTEMLCDQVLSLPMHTEMKEDDQAYIIESVKSFFLI